MFVADVPGFQLVCLTILYDHIHHDKEHVAASATIATLLQLFLVAASALIFATSISGSVVAGTIRTLEKLEPESFDKYSPHADFADGEDFTLHHIPDMQNLEEALASQPDNLSPWLVKHRDKIYFSGKMVKRGNRYLFELNKQNLKDLVFHKDTLTEHGLYPEIYQEIIEKSLASLRNEMADLFRNSLLVAAINSLFSVAFFGTSKYMLQYVLQQDQATASITQEFELEILPILPFTFFFFSASEIAKCFEFTAPMYINAASFIVSIGAAIALIDHAHMKDAGILVPYNVQSCFSAALFGYYVLFHPRFRDLKLLAHLRDSYQDNWPKFREFVATGTGLTVGITAEMIFGAGLAMISGAIDLSLLAAFSLTIRYTLINLLLAVQFALAGSIRFGNALGSNMSDHDIYLSGKYSIVLCVLVSSVIPAMAALLPDEIIWPTVINDPLIARYYRQLVPFVAAGSILDAWTYGNTMQLQRLNDVSGAAAVRVAGTISGWVIAAMMGMKHQEANAIGWGFLGGMMFSAATSGLRWYYLINKLHGKNSHPQQDSQATIPISKPETTCSTNRYGAWFKSQKIIPDNRCLRAFEEKTSGENPQLAIEPGA